ncbi:MAG TPA: hypothetical protein DCS93_23345 [Microscillaceae bacterium]|nr:hypothetical protein [Microscillaceae bacterium]
MILLSLGRVWWEAEVKRRAEALLPQPKKDGFYEKQRRAYQQLLSRLDAHYTEGGEAFFKTVSDHTRYPTPALKNCITGTVKVGLEVDYTGRVLYKVLQDISYGTVAAVLEALQKTEGKWKELPFGHASRYFELQVTFNLEEHRKVREGHVFISSSTLNTQCPHTVNHP